MDTDRNLLFGVLALQADLLNNDQFAEACTAWSVRKNIPLSQLLVERGWLSERDRADVERLLQRKLKKHKGDIRSSLAEVAGPTVCQSLESIADSDFHASLIGLTGAAATQHPTPTTGIGPIPFITTSLEPHDRGRYTVTGLHARGGMGQVWLARDNDLGREVVLKELRPEVADRPAVLARFLEESQITGQLEHPSIVPVYELVRLAEGRQPFYSMRFVRGRTLANAISDYHHKRRHGQARPLELRDLLGAFVSVCNAVAYAHSRGVLHRDLKPHNVVLGSYGEVMVLDWGLAKLVGRPQEEASPFSVAVEATREQTVQGQVLGTPAYMPPEQAEGRLGAVDHRSDVYGLGAILYEILTGQPPFQGPDTLTILRNVLQETPIAPRHHVAATPLPLEAICLKALAREPARRYAKADDLAHDVQRWLADEPVTAYPEPLSIKARRWLGRHRTLVTATAATIGVALVSLVLATVSLKAANDREHQSRTRAEDNFKLARDAVDRYFTRVSDSPKLKAHALEKLRQELLQEASGFYEQFVQQQSDAPGLRLELGWAYARLGIIQCGTGESAAAEALYGKAIAVFEALARDGVDLPQCQDALASTNNQLGILQFTLRRLDRAQTAFEQALAIEEQLARDHPDTALYRSNLADTHNSLANLHAGARQPDMAETHYQQALALYEQLVQENPKIQKYQLRLASINNNLGLFYDKIPRPDKALVAHERARAIATQLDRAYPDTPEYQALLGECYVGLGNLYADTAPAKAAAAYRKAIPIQEKLARKHPDVLDYAARLGLSYYNMGNVVRDNVKPPEALSWYEKAFETLHRVLEVESRHTLAVEFLADSRVGRALALAMMGDHARAMQDAEEARAHPPEAPIIVFNLACTYALCSTAVGKDAKLPPSARTRLQEEYNARAVEVLRQAVACGYKDVAAMKQDSDLEPLRRRADFKKLLQELEEANRKKSQRER
jgi:serine/threonine-protein kinase